MGHLQRVLFLHPPQTDYFLPPLGPACLIAFLKAHRPDLSYRFIDLNVDYVRWLISPEQIMAARHDCETAFERLRRHATIDPQGRRELQAQMTALQQADHIQDAPRPLIDYLLEPEIVGNRQAYQVPKNALGHMMHLHSLNYGQMVANPEKMIWVEHGVEAWDSAVLLETLAHPDADPYTPFHAAHAELAQEIMQCDVLCLSLLYYEQTLGAFSAAAFAKRLRPDLPIVMGGSWITAIRHACQRTPELFTYVDALIPFAGEVSLLEAIQRLDRRGHLHGSPNAMTRQDGQVLFSEVSNFPRVEFLPAPDFDEFALHRYMLPEPVLPFQLTRGCYWGQCTFCTHHMAQGLGYSVAQTHSVGDKLAYLADRYQVNRFYFVDEAIPPAKLRDIPNAIKAQQLDLHWMSECRLERSLSREAFDQLAESGCQLLLFGLETGSQRVMDLMKKGVQLSDAQRCVHDCAEAGIYTGLFLMFGFPTETIDDVLKTYDFVDANRAWIDNIGTSVFTLTAESPIAEDPARFGVTLVPESCRGVALKEDLAYHAAHGLQRHEAEQVNRLLQQTRVFHDILQNCPFPRRSHALFVPSRHQHAQRSGEHHKPGQFDLVSSSLDTLMFDINDLRERFGTPPENPPHALSDKTREGAIHLSFSGVERLTPRSLPIKNS